MRLRPIHRQVLLKLDPEDRTVGTSGLLVAPDVDSIVWCKKCGRHMEAIRESVCNPEADVELDKRTDRYVYKGEDTGHHMESITVPIVVEKARRATVIASGTPDFDPGERVVIDFASGRPAEDDIDSPYRLVAESAILARIEEDEDDVVLH